MWVMSYEAWHKSMVAKLKQGIFNKVANFSSDQSQFLFSFIWHLFPTINLIEVFQENWG